MYIYMYGVIESYWIHKSTHLAYNQNLWIVVPDSKLWPNRKMENLIFKKLVGDSNFLLSSSETLKKTIFSFDQ